MVDKNLMVIAYNHQEWFTVAYLMNNLQAQYLEGFVDSAATAFNQMVGKLPKVCLDIMTDTNVFGSDYTVEKAQPTGLKLAVVKGVFIIIE